MLDEAHYEIHHNNLLRVASMRIMECDVCCPECGIWHYDTQLWSIYIGEWRQWSDGYGFGTYGRQDSGLRYCTCGKVFQSNSAQQRRSLRRRYWNWWKLRYLNEPLLPKAYRVSRENAHSILSMGSFRQDKAVERQLRTMAWWHANMPQRQVRSVALQQVRTFRDNSESVLKDARFLEKLIMLLSDEESPNWMMLGDAYRSMGRFDEAIVSYGKIDAGPSGWTELLIEQARRGCRTVIELSPPPQI